MEIPAAILEAQRSGRALRIHRDDGEVLVLQVLACDEAELVYAVFTSTHPERYGVCDSTGFRLPLGEITSADVLERPPPRYRAVLE